MTISACLILIAVLFTLSFEYAGRKWGIPAIPTLPWQRRVMIDALKKYMSPRHSGEDEKVPTIIELGCGWGGLIAGLTRAYPNSRVIGYEGYPPAGFISRLRFRRVKSIKILQQDFFRSDLSGADVIVCYLSHDLMKRLQGKFDSELKPGALVISNAFPLPDWTPIDHIITRKIVPLHVWVYRKT